MATLPNSRISQEPSRQAVEYRLLMLLEGQLCREDVSDWAMGWMGLGKPLICDRVVGKSLLHLACCDMKINRSEYLHGPQSFRRWLYEFRAACETSKVEPGNRSS